MRQNICLFFKYIQALVGLRITVPDGQHRFMLYTQMLRGVFEITPFVPLKSWGANTWPGPTDMEIPLDCEFQHLNKCCQPSFRPHLLGFASCLILLSFVAYPHNTSDSAISSQKFPEGGRRPMEKVPVVVSNAGPND